MITDDAVRRAGERLLALSRTGGLPRFPLETVPASLRPWIVGYPPRVSPDLPLGELSPAQRAAALKFDALLVEMFEANGIAAALAALSPAERDEVVRRLDVR